MSLLKKTLVLDFDGVLHSYTSGWRGAAVIPDPPVPGALRALVEYLGHFDVAIVSSRSHQWGGRRAMKRWLERQLYETLYSGRFEHLFQHVVTADLHRTSMEPWDIECRAAARSIVKRITFPRHKPPAHVTLDDRAITFKGVWPDLLEIAEFKPWNKM